MTVRWPECSGFLVLPESQSHWLLMHRGSTDVDLALIGLGTTNQTWHHLKFAERKRKHDASLVHSKSLQKIVRPSNK